MRSHPGPRLTGHTSRNEPNAEVRDAIQIACDLAPTSSIPRGVATPYVRTYLEVVS